MAKKELTKKEIMWLDNYTELYNHCKDCPYYHVQDHEYFKNNPMQTTHRCKALSTEHRDEYNRGYYQILDIGMICPQTNKQITKLTIGEVMKMVNDLKDNE